MAFFPCIRFENQIGMWFRGASYTQAKWNLEQKMQHCIKLHDELNEMYDLVNMLFIVCIRKGLRLIMENPYSNAHYLYRYWCFEPSIIDLDRRERGDYFAKPTQFWFLNIKPKYNFLLEPQEWNAIEKVNAVTTMNIEDCKAMGANSYKTARSMIHPTYAKRFIREYIL